jgi:mRNA interferase HigB
MKARLYKNNTILAFVQSNSGSRQPFEKWLKDLKTADWNTPSDIKNTYNSADLLGGGTNRVVFNIGGNNYRMICQYVFSKYEVKLYICWIGTHSMFDRICALNKQYYINEY